MRHWKRLKKIPRRFFAEEEGTAAEDLLHDFTRRFDLPTGKEQRECAVFPGDEAVADLFGQGAKLRGRHICGRGLERRVDRLEAEGYE